MRFGKDLFAQGLFLSPARLASTRRSTVAFLSFPMKSIVHCLFALGLVLSSATTSAQVPTAGKPGPLPRSWIDAETGHRVVQLSIEPGSNSLYFTQYAYTAGGAKLVMTTPSGIDLVTLATGEIEHVLSGHVGRVLQMRTQVGELSIMRTPGQFTPLIRPPK